MSLTRPRNTGAACLAASAIVSALAAGMCVSPVTPASASVKDSKDRFTWSASAYKERNFDRPSAPLQIVFRDGSDVPLTRERITAHLKDGWLGMDRRTNPLCTDARYAAFPSPDRTTHLWAAPSLYVSTNASSPCIAQAHGRIFNDVRHADLYNHAAGEYFPANFHLDKPRIKFVCTPRPYPMCRYDRVILHDRPAESGQASRRRALRKMSRGTGAAHCRDFAYGKNPDFKQVYYGEDYDGWIGRISLVHEASAGGC